ncbi:hypothetical protein DV515_00003579, partial [Chloebia gouldiae]
MGGTGHKGFLCEPSSTLDTNTVLHPKSHPGSLQSRLGSGSLPFLAASILCRLQPAPSLYGMNIRLSCASMFAHKLPSSGSSCITT